MLKLRNYCDILSSYKMPSKGAKTSLWSFNSTAMPQELPENVNYVYGEKKTETLWIIYVQLKSRLRSSSITKAFTNVKGSPRAISVSDFPVHDIVPDENSTKILGEYKRSAIIRKNLIVTQDGVIMDDNDAAPIAITEDGVVQESLTQDEAQAEDEEEAEKDEKEADNEEITEEPPLKMPKREFTPTTTSPSSSSNTPRTELPALQLIKTNDESVYKRNRGQFHYMEKDSEQYWLRLQVRNRDSIIPISDKESYDYDFSFARDFHEEYCVGEEDPLLKNPFPADDPNHAIYERMNPAEIVKSVRNSSKWDKDGFEEFGDPIR